MFRTNMANKQYEGFRFGKENTNKNCAEFYYYHAGAASNSNQLRMGFYGGAALTLTVGGAGTYPGSWTSSSDKRLKTLIRDLTDEETDETIDNIRPISFYRTKEEIPRRRYFGVVAQELVEVRPELVYDDMTDDHYLSVDYIQLVPFLIKKVQKQQKQINDLNARLERIEQLLK